ncbi:MAG: PAS domain S-box protein [Nitrospina sp.]|nr:PAS domain S-box protein [Nitrospina sp.]
MELPPPQNERGPLTHHQIFSDEKSLKALFDVIVNPVIIIDRVGRIQAVNPATHQVFGYRDYEIIGQNVNVLMPEPYRSEHDEYLQNYFNTGKAKIIGVGRDVVALRKNGEEFPINLAISRMDRVDGTFFVGVVTDISLQKKSEQDLKNSEAKVEALFDVIVNPVIIIDRTGRIQAVNPATRQVFGYTDDELLGQNVRVLMPEPYRSEHDGYLQNYFNTGKGKIIGVGRDVVALRKNGEEFPINLAISRMDQESGTFFVGVVTDISSHIKLQRELRVAHAQALESQQEAEAANQSKTLFLANMSHEIRTPMNAVLGYAQVLQRNESISTAGQKQLQAMIRSGEHLLFLINDILDLSKIESGKMDLNVATFDLSLLVKDVLHILKPRFQKKQLEYELNYFTDKIFDVQGDEGKLRQSLINLLGNAIKFTDRGKIVLEVRNPKPEHFLFLVKDTGCGLAPDELAVVFETFAQTEEGRKRGGAGLGLSITKRQIALMGGQLAAQSRAGEGSTFYFSLKLPRPSGEKKVNYKSERITAIRGGISKRILVADDNSTNCEILVTLLTPVGFDVAVVSGGKDVLSELQTSQFDLLLIDQAMPDQTGISTIEMVRKSFSREAFPIILLSASVLESDVESAYRAGCDYFLPKPFNVEELLHSMGTLLDLEYDKISLEATEIHEKDVQVERLDISDEWVSSMIAFSESGNIDDIEEMVEAFEPTDQESKNFKHFLEDRIAEADTITLVRFLKKLKTTLPGS